MRSPDRGLAGGDDFRVFVDADIAELRAELPGGSDGGGVPAYGTHPPEDGS